MNGGASNFMKLTNAFALAALAFLSASGSDMIEVLVLVLVEYGRPSFNAQRRVQVIKCQMWRKWRNADPHRSEYLMALRKLNIYAYNALNLYELYSTKVDT
jgi:hypothetical protein